MPVSPSLVRSWQPIESSRPDGLVPPRRPSLRNQIVCGHGYNRTILYGNQYRIVSSSALQGGEGNGNGGTPTGKWIGDGDDGEGNHRPVARIHWWMAFSILLTGVTAWRALRIRKDSGNELDLKVSIIVPTLNESKIIADTVAYLRSLDPPPHEIIVVDANSSDGTAQAARKAGATVIRAARGRARQMNAGAGVSSGDILMFVHCDSRPPKEAIRACHTVLHDQRNVLGGFTTSIEHEGKILWLPTIHQYISTYYAPALFAPRAFLRGLRCMFGDQSLFCRQSDFRRVGGFDTRLPIMEDTDLCVRLHRGGLASGHPGREVQVVGSVNRTSGRRIGPWGTWKSTMIQFTIAWAWWRGATLERLWDLYETLYTDAFR